MIGTFEEAGEVTNVGEAKLEADLPDGLFVFQQQLPGFGETVVLEELIDTLPKDFAEELFEIGFAHQDRLRQIGDRRRGGQVLGQQGPYLKDLTDIERIDTAAGSQGPFVQLLQQTVEQLEAAGMIEETDQRFCGRRVAQFPDQGAHFFGELLMDKKGFTVLQQLTQKFAVAFAQHGFQPGTPDMDRNDFAFRIGRDLQGKVCKIIASIHIDTGLLINVLIACHIGCLGYIKIIKDNGDIILLAVGGCLRHMQRDVEPKKLKGHLEVFQ